MNRLNPIVCAGITLLFSATPLMASEPTGGTLIQLGIYALPLAVGISVFWDWSRGIRRRKWAVQHTDHAERH